jgi:hypothetical protein
LNPVETFSSHEELLCRGSVYSKRQGGEGVEVQNLLRISVLGQIGWNWRRTFARRSVGEDADATAGRACPEPVEEMPALQRRLPVEPTTSSFRSACGSFSAVDLIKDPQKDAHQPSKKRIAIIPGDGIGQEVIPQALKVIKASGADVEMSEFDWSADRYLRDGTTVPPDGFAMLGRDFDAGSRPIFTPKRYCSACASRWISTPTCGRCGCSMRRYVR